MNAWYATLNKPALTPPDGVFAPVWTVLYVSIACAIVLYYRAPSKPRVWLTSVVLAAHLAANAVWTPLFFRLRSPPAALVDILFLDLSLLLLIRLFWKASRVAALILIPYLLWVLFATYLNLEFVRLN